MLQKFGKNFGKLLQEKSEIILNIVLKKCCYKFNLYIKNFKNWKNSFKDTLVKKLIKFFKKM